MFWTRKKIERNLAQKHREELAERAKWVAENQETIQVALIRMSARMLRRA